MRFFTALLANVLGTLIAIGLLLFLGLLFLLAIASASDQTPRVPADAVLTLELSGTLSERVSDDPMMQAFGGESAFSVHDLAYAIREAATDDRIQAMWVQTGQLQSSWASLEAIQRALSDFRDSGKPLVASSPDFYMSENEYYLAAAADTIYMAPESFFEFNGFALSVTFFADLLDRLEIEPQIVRAGNFKSATEPFTRQSMSVENREQLSGILSGIENAFVSSVGQHRNIEEDRLRKMMDEDALITAGQAVTSGLIDGLAHEGDIRASLERRIGIEPEEEMQTVSMADYSRSVRPGSSSSDEIAVVYVGGTILGGDSEDELFSTAATATSGQITKALRSARENHRTRAVVVRVDSPGGFAPAADAILSEIMRTSEDLPVIVSMGGLAASGGYWIAMGGESIVAESTTLTGSIGVFSLSFALGSFFDEKLGVTFDDVQTSPYADMFDGIDGFSPAERVLMQNATDQSYRHFIEVVSSGREMSPDDVRTVADGRVWTGAQALERGLVDELGGLDRAIELAAQRAGLMPEEVSVSWYPRPKTFVELLTRSLGSSASVMVKALKGQTDLGSEVAGALGRNADLNELRYLIESRGTIQARTPFRIDIN